MNMLVVGLGNPTEEYAMTRHNAGRNAVMAFAQSCDEAVSWKLDKKLRALRANVSVGNTTVDCLLPETFMNNSGGSVKPLITSAKKAESLIVVYDDLDIPFGVVTIAFNKGAGGHNGLASIIKAVKTKEFIRVRVGVAPTTPSGKIKKPKGEEAVLKFILGEFSKKEKEVLPEVYKKIILALETIVRDGKDKAMTALN
jgi:PTH1 family peptidyl-tRNA hydrolase